MVASRGLFGVRRVVKDRRAATALEFGIIALPFFMWMLVILELSWDLFTQVALDDALHVAARQIQTGNAQYLTNGQAFINNYLCPAAGGRLICSNLYISVQPANFGSGQDYYNLTTGVLPTSGNTLVLSSFTGTSSFCNANASQFMLISAIYVGPTFLGGLLPGLFTVQYNGARVHATLSTTGVVTEPYNQTAYTGNGTPAASCTAGTSSA